MSNHIYTTQEGYNKLVEELKYLKSEGRKDIARQIAEARDKGDLSENAEYDAAKDAQGLLEMRIAKLGEKIANTRIIDASAISKEQVSILSTVTIKNLKSGAEISYTLVSEDEANIKEKKISVTSPIAKGLLGKKKGETANIKVPTGIVEFKILTIE